MTTLREYLRMISGGRVTIPYSIRKRLQWEDGSLLLCQHEDGSSQVSLFKIDTAIAGRSLQHDLGKGTLSLQGTSL